MKKRIDGIALLIITGAIVLAACNKQNVTPAKAISKIEQSSNPEKGGLTDSQLIQIIKGRNRNYSKMEEIEELLFDNCRLSSSVLRALIDEKRFPDYIIEEMTILSAPISDADLTYLNLVRPSLSTTTIQAAKDIHLNEMEVSIINTSPRQMLFSSEIKKKSSCPDGCGDSEIKGEGLVVLTLTSITTPLNPVEMRPCHDGGRWTCGTAKEVRIVRIDGTTVTVQLTCTQSADKCFRNPERAVR